MIGFDEETTRAIAKEIIEIFELVRLRQSLYTHGGEPEHYVSLYMGIDFAARKVGVIIGPDQNDTVYEDALRGRGWEQLPTSLVNHLREQGLNNHTIIDTMISFDVEVIKRRYKLIL